MKSPKKSKLWRDGYSAGIERGREMQRADDQETIGRLTDALNRALTENLAMRPKPKHLDAIARQGSHGGVAR